LLIEYVGCGEIVEFRSFASQPIKIALGTVANVQVENFTATVCAERIIAIAQEDPEIKALGCSISGNGVDQSGEIDPSVGSGFQDGSASSNLAARSISAS